MSNYDSYTRDQLIKENESLKRENNFLKEYIRGTKEFKDLNRWVENEFGGKE